MKSFPEQEYLNANPDVKEAVINGEFASGEAHFLIYGQWENRAGAPEDDIEFEQSYLGANPDVKEAVTKGHFRNGRHHYDIYGKDENREGVI